MACVLAAAVLFYFANRAAYKGYFSEDDLDNLTWPTYVGLDVYFHQLLSFTLGPDIFRPVGDLYYRYLYRAFHLNYVPYVVTIQLIHGLNVMLLFLLLRRLDFSRVAAGTGALFYSFHAAVLEIWWKPMYIFDLLCATLCLISLLLYIRGRWILALLPFWLAYKSKEIAVALPIALLAWEWLLGHRKWKRLIPFFLISLNFGLQALWRNRTIDPGNAYALQFSPQLLWHSVVFYSSAIFLGAFAGLGLLLLPIWLRDRRLYFGLIATLALLGPMIAVPGRQESVYWYVPMIGVAVVIACIATKTPGWAIAILLLLWLPFNYAQLREKRSQILAEGNRDRVLIATLQEYARQVRPVRAVVYQNVPDHIRDWGLDGAIAQVFGFPVKAAWSERPDAKEAMAKLPVLVIRFKAPPLAVEGLLRTRPEIQPYLHMMSLTPESQLLTGWYDQGSELRWIAPRADAMFYRPAIATQFEIVAGMTPESLDRYGPSQVTLLEDGQAVGTEVLSQPAQTLRWKLPPGNSGDKHITILSKPARRGEPQDPRTLGIAVRAIGYTPF
ncbi:MAG TPA: hypothetical protein VMH05_12910 [Bryobacteraceae bacterium]|nr:hypothetical protein [Bryobacteraceae bacterium]